MKKSLLSTALLSMIAGAGIAQTPKISPCETYGTQEYYMKTIPGYKQQVDAVMAKTAREFSTYENNLAAQKTSTISPAYTFTIPVVFHILHTNGPENISDAACMAALDQVNKDFGRMGSDISSIDPLYEPLYVDSKMKFVLAKKDPSGNCTNGIVHHYDVNTKWGRSLSDYKYSTVGTFNWSPKRYMNIYIVDAIESSGAGITVGYTFLPGTSPNFGSDAIVYNRNFLSGLAARSLSHEIGHWFGLSHTFGGTNEAGVVCGNDDIGDTPATAGFFSNCPLPYTALNDSCDPGKRPNMNNIMDYSGCPMMFTQGQTTKMRFTAQSSTADRNYLVDTANLVFTGLLNMTYTLVPKQAGGYDTLKSYSPAPATVCGPVADFYSNRAKTCQGLAVVYNSTSFNNVTGITYNWTFEGGTPATSTAAAPSVTYATPGNYSTTLTVTNAQGSSTKVRTPFPQVSWHPDQVAYPAIEGFEAPNANSLPIGWNAINPDYGTITWESANYGSNSSKCVILANANEGSMMFTGSNVDILETNLFNLSNTSNVTISYDYSYARKSGQTGDLFTFEYSTDCGGNWTSISTTPTTASLSASGGTVNAPYIPFTQAKWVTKNYASASLTAIMNKPDVKFRFTFTNTPNGTAQNFYLDNFRISGTVGLEDMENTIGLTIYPNPTASSSILEFTSPVDAKATVNVYDVTGRVVEQASFNASAAVSSTYNINRSNMLTAGIYFVTLDLNNQKITKKLVIE